MVAVTAHIRQQRLQDTPLSVLALSEATLEQRAIQELVKVMAAIPSFAMTNEGPDAISISIWGMSGQFTETRIH